MARSEFSSARPSIDRRSFSIPRGLVMQGLRPDHTTPTPEFEQEETQYTSAQSHQSPTRSDFSQLNVISSFEINKKLLQANFASEINKKKKDWFYKNFNTEERSKIREEYYEYMNTRQENVFFFEWFEQEYLKSIQVIKNGEKLWKTSRGEVSSIIPPLEEVRFPNIENKEVTASPFKMITEKREVQIKDIQNIHSQLNYTNQLLHQMVIHEPEAEPKIVNKEQSQRLGKSLIKPFKFSEQELKGLKIGQDASSDLEEINKKLDELKISKINTLTEEETINKITGEKPPRLSQLVETSIKGLLSRIFSLKNGSSNTHLPLMEMG